VYFDLPRWARFWKRGRRGVHLYYYLWQIGARSVVRRLNETVRFDLVHHVTFARYVAPSFLATELPFVWGPVGGGESAPKQFWRDFGAMGVATELVRELARSLGERDPFVRRTAKSSAVAFASTAATAARLRALGARHVHVISQLGLSSAEIQKLTHLCPPTEPPVRFVSVGNLLYWKGVYLGLRAFARASLPEAEYWVIGDGRERSRLEALARDLGVADRVTFHGQLSREKALDAMAHCHVLVHPSLHDSGGYVCLEAMCAGLPVICLQLGGPADQVTIHEGIPVEASGPDQAVEDIATAMVRLYRDPVLRQRLGAAGKARASSVYSWDQKGNDFGVAYQRIVRDRSSPFVIPPSAVSLGTDE
jgi:glycosyltransferase involved in cell wall biosynthesis